jgi:hypothetical protein
MVDPIIVTHRPFDFNRRSYEWRQVGQNWELTTASQIVAQVVPDALHPGMYRIDLGDDPLSDMVNLTRAKDAALSLADRALEKGRQRAQGGLSMHRSQPGLATTPPQPSSAPGEAPMGEPIPSPGKPASKKGR